MKKPQPQPEIIILGMHRSGTSMVGGVLQHLGVNLGKDLPGRQVSNPLGHFEDGDFLDLNNRILAKSGGSWDDPPTLEKIISLGDSFAGEIGGLIQNRRERNQASPWGWKDPRTCLTMQLYLPYLSKAHIVWCERAPVDIARSLFKRNQIHLEEGLELTEQYQARIADFIQTHPQLPYHRVCYRELVENPAEQILSLVAFLDLTPSDQQVEQAVSFVLPREKVNRAKTLLQWKYWLSLPLRGVRKLFRVFLRTDYS